MGAWPSGGRGSGTGRCGADTWGRSGAGGVGGGTVCVWGCEGHTGGTCASSILVCASLSRCVQRCGYSQKAVQCTAVRTPRRWMHDCVCS